MSKRTPKLCLHKASGKAVVRINGKDHYLGQFGSKEARREYDRLIKEWQATGCSISFGSSVNTVTVAMLVADYRAHAARYYRDSSEPITIKIATDFLADYYDLPANELSPMKLKAVREKILATPNKLNGKPQSRVYCNRLVGMICRMYKWGAENELVSITTSQALSNVSGLKKGRCEARETEKVLPVEDSIVDATLPHCGPVVADMIRLQRITGMRPGEICCIAPGMIDRSKKVWVADLPKHKTAWRGKNRSIYFGPKAQVILKKYLARDEAAACFSPCESEEHRRAELTKKRVTPPNHGNSVGTNRKGRPRFTIGSSYTTSSYRKAVQYACEKAFPISDDATSKKIEEWKAKYLWSPNQLRHSAATEARAKLSIEHASVLLGHSDIDTTLIYAERDEKKAIEVAELIG